VNVLYQPYWCEENIWHLCRALEERAMEPRAVFVTSVAQAFPIRHQRAAPRMAWMTWDYHVVALSRGDGDPGLWIWDLDSWLGAPAPADQWLEVSFDGSEGVPPSHRPRFRVMAGRDYVSALMSDRSHMRVAGGGFAKAPPPWPTIGVTPAHGGSNLARFLDLDDPWIGDVLDLRGFRELITQRPSHG
jgi:hypothetical protein